MLLLLFEDYFEIVVFTFELFYILEVIADDLSDIRSNKKAISDLVVLTDDARLE